MSIDRRMAKDVVHIYNGILLLLFSLCHVRLLAAPWTIAHWAPLFMEFFQYEYWSQLPFPSSGDLPDPGIKLKSPVSPAFQADS